MTFILSEQIIFLIFYFNVKFCHKTSIIYRLNFARSYVSSTMPLCLTIKQAYLALFKSDPIK